MCTQTTARSHLNGAPTISKTREGELKGGTEGVGGSWPGREGSEVEVAVVDFWYGTKYGTRYARPLEFDVSIRLPARAPLVLLNYVPLRGTVCHTTSKDYSRTHPEYGVRSCYGFDS